MKILSTILILLSCLFTINCSHSSGSSSGASASSTDTISLSPSPATVAESETITLTPSGGTSPYSFTLVTGGGSFSVSSGTSTVYTAPSYSGTMEIQVVDSASHSGTFNITVGTSGTLTMSPQNNTVSLSGTLTFSTSDGTSPYTYSVVSGGGSFSGDIYYAPSTAQTVIVKVTDSAGNYGETYVYVSSSSTSAICDGAYSVTVNGVAGTMDIVEDDSGNLGGYLSLSGYVYPMSGTCSVSGSSGTIALKNLDFGTIYSGTVSVSGSSVSISGTLTNSSSTYSWSASKTGNFSASSTSQSCEGTYSVVINGNAAAMSLVEDDGGNFIGDLYGGGYQYVVAGTCIISGTSGTASFTNLTTSSTYSGTVTVSGSKLSMSGTFTLTSGTNYKWSASQQ